MEAKPEEFGENTTSQYAFGDNTGFDVINGTGRSADDLTDDEIRPLRGILLKGGTGLDCATHTSLHYGLGAREATRAGYAAAVAQLMVQGCFTDPEEVRVMMDAGDAVINKTENALQRLLADEVFLKTVICREHPDPADIAS